MVVEVIPGLLLGSMGDVIAILGSHSNTLNIARLLSILNNPIDWSEIKTPQGNLMAKYVSAPDLPSSDLLSHFPSCVDFIEECLSDDGGSPGGASKGYTEIRKKVLVHCEHGVSRSATIVLAYLMKKRKMTFSKALEFLKDKKPDIRPNLGFQEQLKLWEMMGYTLDNEFKLYKSYVLYHQSRAMKRNGYVQSMDLTPNPNPSASRGSLYKCRKCRHVLLSGDSVLQHDIGKGPSAFTGYRHGNSSTGCFLINNAKKELDKSSSLNKDGSEPSVEEPVKIESETLNNSSPVDDVLSELSALRSKVTSLKIESSCDLSQPQQQCSSLFVEPVEWMGPLLLGHKEGKLLCPKCCSRIGSFDWSGSQCSCGSWITPSFKIVKSKVDHAPN